MDVANEIDHSFWRYLRTTVKKNKNVYLLAETWNIGLPWINGDQFDGVMNYVLYDLILEYFVLQKITLQDFTDKLKKLFFTYPDHTWPAMFNCLDSHDTPRLLTLANHNVAIFKISYLFLFLCPGSPSIYYGDEIGLDGDNDPLCRKCMIWDKEKWNFELLTFLKKIIDLRKEHPILGNDGNLIIIDNKNILIFYKQKDNTKYLIVINNTNKTQDLDITTLTNKTTDLITNKTLNNKLKILPYSCYIF
ncbi:alpha-amylase family glycosyl hydrolase [Spiroplasma endosymbiont of Stenodema calcarata]|uniref:alpha-amylase family glycosyl hydrolase n=1 Tax=Spiroplasma endosymbiont of Stenodema calcarata TaxID=3139328 RepID=UPI003CCABA18